YFARYEFSAPYLLSCSDCEALTIQELLELADEDSKKIWTDLKLGYTESQGHPLLREQISSLYTNINEKQVITFVPEEAIFIAMNSLIQPGDHVIATFPGYQSLYEVAKSIGSQVDFWQPTFSGEWKFDTNELAGLIREQTTMLIINFPHNPTGATIDKENLIHIIELARQHNLYLFSDEMYRFLEYDSKSRLPSVSELYEKGISLCGMSKSFALAGLRIGWLITQDHNAFTRFAELKDYTTICSSAPSEILAIMGLQAKDLIIQRNLEIIKNNLALLDDFFSQYPDLFAWYHPQAGPIAFPALKHDKPISDLCLDLVGKKGIMLLPADVYDFSVNHFRLGFARKNFGESLAKFNEYLKEYF
ncbi:MAG: aminotransferase class I/II-fold pyridoxal phosphate-dependent enzyme, partial [Spirochaetes bacterium]|nr:aminotransferase class I/II-fold pyridoxal phosphate-dependent enzyme [Spirochaetota bacterium]